MKTTERIFMKILPRDASANKKKLIKF